MTTTARVVLTLELHSLGSWGDDCQLSQVYKQAAFMTKCSTCGAPGNLAPNDNTALTTCKQALQVAEAERDTMKASGEAFLQEVQATLEDVSNCLDRYADVDDGDYGEPEANAAMRQKCDVDEILSRFPNNRDKTFRAGDEALHTFIPDTCSHGVMEWKPPVAQGFAAWVGENGVLHRHGHPTNPLIALAGAIIKHRDASLAAVTAERDAVKKIIDFWFAPWGAWKTEAWEDMSGDQPYSPDAALELIRAALSLDAQVKS